MNIQNIKIQDIKIENRIRKDYGNIEELARSIKEHGLLQPIVITPDKMLIAGERRLKAIQMLGLNEINAIIKTAEDREEQLLCEIEENEQRKEFTTSERIMYGLELEQIQAIKAKKSQGKRTDLTLSSNEDKVKNAHDGRTDKIVGEKVGMSESGYFRAKKVVDSGNEEIIKKMDNKEIGINTAYEIVKGKRTEDGKPVKKPKQNNSQKTIINNDATVDFSFLAEEFIEIEDEEDNKFNEILDKTIEEAELMQQFKNVICIPYVSDFFIKTIKQKLKTIGDKIDNVRDEDRQALINAFNILKKIIKQGANNYENR
ncbi:MAG: ParB N-terminal domain-containing protein [Candidatus Odinarchaeota archaeon]